MNPYEILKIPLDADDRIIKQAYLQQVKQYPPEREPEQFKCIKEAYDMIKDEYNRLNYHLFNEPGIAFEDWLNQAVNIKPAEQFSFEQFEQLLWVAVDNPAFLDKITACPK